MTTVISAKIPDELKKKAKLHHVNLSKIVRKAIEDEVRKLEEEKLSGDLERVGRVLRKSVSSGDIVKAVRASRNER